MFLATCMKELQRVSPGISFHEETAPAHFLVFTNCVSTRDFDLVLNSLKPVVVGEEVQCFDFPLPRDIKHKPMDARLLTNVDDEGGQENSTSVYSENLDVFKDACNIAEINSKYAKCFAERMKNMRKEMYHIYLAENPILFDKFCKKDQPLTKCGLFPVKTVLKSEFCQPFVMEGVVWLGIFLVQLPFISHPAVYQLSGIYLSDFDVVVPFLKFQKHLEFDFLSAVVH
jgi:hypothetical protein